MNALKDDNEYEDVEVTMRKFHEVMYETTLTIRAKKNDRKDAAKQAEKVCNLHHKNWKEVGSSIQPFFVHKIDGEEYEPSKNK